MIIWLVGMMGAGKSTVGRALAEELGTSFHDTDTTVESITGMPIPDLWDREGEKAFRELEAAVVETMARTHTGVIATGGGVVLDAARRHLMRDSGTVVWLKVPVEVLARRVERSSNRPLLEGEGSPKARLAVILQERGEAYEQAADISIDAGDSSTDHIVRELMPLWNP